MKFLLFGGARNTGKTESISRLTENLINKGYKEIYSKTIVNKYCDFQCVLQGKEKTILIHSHTDNIYSIKKLIEFYKSFDKIDIVITSIRNMDDGMRKNLKEMFPIDFLEDEVVEIPLAKVVSGKTRGRNIVWYLDKIEKLTLKLIELEPFEL